MSFHELIFLIWQQLLFAAQAADKVNVARK
jgi:hypothetical protein